MRVAVGAKTQFSRRTFSRALQVSFFIGLSGCSSLNEITPPNLSLFSTGSEACDSSSAECLQKRAARLRTLTSDAAHAWVRQVEPVDGYAAGTRLFAYRIAKTKLRCADLAHGLVELQAAHAAYGKPVSGVPAPQAKRTLSLIVKVRSELSHEMRRRSSAAASRQSSGAYCTRDCARQADEIDNLRGDAASYRRRNFARATLLVARATRRGVTCLLRYYLREIYSSGSVMLEELQEAIPLIRCLPKKEQRRAAVVLTRIVRKHEPVATAQVQKRLSRQRLRIQGRKDRFGKMFRAPVREAAE